MGSQITSWLLRPNVLVPLELAYVLAISMWIVLEKRPPLATLAWIAFLSGTPIFGVAIFLALGPRRARRFRSRHATVRRRLQASSSEGLIAPSITVVREQVPPALRSLVTLGLNNSEAPISAGNAVQVLRNGTEAFPAIEAAIANAHHHVHLEYYIFEDGETARRIRDRLIERLRAGVQVRLLIDAFGSRLAPALLDPLRAAGAEVEAFNRFLLGKLRLPRPNFRSHRKIVICDGRIAFTGGLNVGDDYAAVDGHRIFRDTHVRIEGPAVRALQMLFLEDWALACGRSVHAPEFFDAPVAGEHLVQVVGSGSDRPWRALQQLYFSAIAGAEDSVRISTPYFVPDQAILAALTTAALRGVDVELLLPHLSDSRLVTYAGRSFYDELLLAGVRIYEYLPGFMHAKTMSIDGALAIIGSANLDRRSLGTDFEVSTLIYSAVVAQELDQMFANDKTVARECTLEHREALPFRTRLAEASARLCAPLL